MPTDKTIEINLNDLTADSLGKLVKMKKEIADDLKKPGKRAPRQKLVNEFQRSDESSERLFEKLRKRVEFDLVNGRGKDTLKKKLFGDANFSKGGTLKNIIGFGLNPQGFIGGLLKGIPGFAAAVAATAIIIEILKKFDELEKKFTDDIRTRLNAERDTEQTARIQAGLAQEIFTAGPGITDPRDAYNTFDEFNNNQQKIETDYTIRTSTGVE